MPHTFRYQNPITQGEAFALRDHQIIKLGDTWFMTGTSAPYWQGESPGVRLYSSRDLLNWKWETWLLETAKLPADCFYKGRLWAPEIHQKEGRFYLTVNSGHGGPNDQDNRLMEEHAIVLFVADKITGPYELITREKPIGKPFKNDASLFTDDDGQTYIYCSGGGLWQARIDLSTGTLLNDDDFQKITSPRDPGNPDWMIGGIEGPFVIKRNGYYYLFFSAWTRGYEVGVMRAKSPLGPWELTPNSPIFGTRKKRHRAQQALEGNYAHVSYEDTLDPYAETGHCAIFEGPDGRDWMSCHYFLEGKQPISGPVLEYADTLPQLGYEPLTFQNNLFSVPGPTWTEQVVTWE